MWNNVENLFREYMGTGLIVIIFCISLIYLWIKENRKYVRIMFIYVPVILLFLFFNPLFAVLLYDLAENEIYYRILWLLPITVTVAFAAVTLYGKLPKKSGKSVSCARLCSAYLRCHSSAGAGSSGGISSGFGTICAAV